MVGTTVSHYKILEHLGGGGMGVVYKAQDLTLHRTVALKFLPPALLADPEAQERFIHEARAASALDHPNICTIHEIGRTDDGQMFIVMGFYEGETLQEKIKESIEDRGSKIEDCINITIQVAEGLARAHEAGIVHRDIKPANIFITTRGEVKILDFGLAKLTGQSLLTKSGTTLGTAAYMSPEQARGETVDHRTDIWSLAVVFYEMLTGKRPFESQYEQALVYSILNEEPRPLRQDRPEVPEVLEQIVTKALSKQPESRYQTAEELLSDLRIARGTEAPGGTVAAMEAAKKVQTKKLRRGLLAAGLAAAILAIALFVVLPLIQDQALASHPRAIAFISLENKTGEPSLEYLRSVLPDVLGATLVDSKYLRVTRSDRIRELMKQIGKDTVEFIDRETGRLLCRRAGIEVMGVGSYTKAGPMFLAEMELIDVNTGERLGSLMKARGLEVESFLKEDGIVDDLARQISRGMGVSQIGSQATVRTVAEVSSSSMDAQRFYERGKLEAVGFNHKEARHFFELAVKKDSTFAVAWFRLSSECQMMADGPAQEFALGQAVKNASRASERDRFQIANADPGLRTSLLKSRGREGVGEGRTSWVSWLKVRCEFFPFDAEFRSAYAQQLSNLGEITQAITEYEKLVQLDPAYTRGFLWLGMNYAYNGEGEKAIQAMERYAELLPGEPDPLESMAECLMILGRCDEGIAKCEESVQVKPDYVPASLALARLYFMKEDYSSAVRWSARAAEIVPTPAWHAVCSWWRAWYLVWSGRLSEAEQVLRASEQKMWHEYQKRNVSESDKNYSMMRIVWLRAWCAYEKGEWKKARLLMSNWANLSGSRWFSQFCLGLIDLQQGHMDSVAMRRERIRDTLAAFSQRDPAGSKYDQENGKFFNNVLEAAQLLTAHRPSEIEVNWTPWRAWFTHIPDAITTASWPLFRPWGDWDAITIEWIPVSFDILPRAYVERGMIDSAISSYELAVKKPPHWLGPIIPRYYYRLARLYEQKGMKEKAIENYTYFLKVWGKADPIFKEPEDARSRLARLKRG